MTLKLRLAPFETLARQKTVETDLTTTEAIYPIALKLLEAADPGDRDIRLIGVGVASLHERAPEPQLGLFDEGGPGKNPSRVADLMDKVSDKFGNDALKRGKLLGRDKNEPERR